MKEFMTRRKHYLVLRRAIGKSGCDKWQIIRLPWLLMSMVLFLLIGEPGSGKQRLPCWQLHPLDKWKAFTMKLDEYQR